ncbi:hypothetical protein H8E07_05765 [bacterium]|nr:hypothetical protein [bacterium]
MAITAQDRKYYTVGIGAMLLVVLLLGLRSSQTVKSVLADKIPYETTEIQQPQLVKEAVKGVSARDSLVACALLDGKLRDPFAQETRKPSTRRTVKAPPRVARLIEPSLAALIFDNVNPTVQITIEGERSDWLRTGDQFRGWQVAEIAAKSVKVKKGDREIVLH